MAQQQSAKEFHRLEKIKAEVAKLSTEQKREVVVTLTDETKVKGFISSFSADRFEVTNTKSRVVTPISFVEVRDVRKRLSTPAKIGMFAAMGGAGVGMLYLVAFGLSKCSVCIGD